MDISKKVLLNRASDADEYFQELIKVLGDTKVKSFLSYCGYMTDEETGERYGSDDETIFILFENGKCLAIDYFDINFLHVHYRDITTDDLEVYEHQYKEKEDFFNNKRDISDSVDPNVLLRTERISLEYDALSSIDVIRITEPYWVTENNAFVLRNPAPEDFCYVIFKMKNGKGFRLRGGDAIDDGCVSFNSIGAVQNIEHIKR